ncbi:porin [Massilia sp. Mn16-1_5]|uniref:porin n=1 Tax=Massilia sp. Mn16-1_5 TaxID=2079199 RepID=UPI00109E447A|nr:porin [Massilia sp. Mn16-1_5]THC39618.1 hypothetical protein C2862_23485 [Massilia sp. Mn16-1_5]
MKAVLLRTSVLGLLASHGLAQAESPQLYGRLNLGIQQMRVHGKASSTRLSNYRSVLGIRGGEDLGEGLRVLFQVEGTLSPDTGAGAVAARDTRVGLAGRWGTLFAGNWTTPYNSASSGLDPFYPTTAGARELSWPKRSSRLVAASATSMLALVQVRADAARQKPVGQRSAHRLPPRSKMTLPPPPREFSRRAPFVAATG